MRKAISGQLSYKVQHFWPIFKPPHNYTPRYGTKFWHRICWEAGGRFKNHVSEFLRYASIKSFKRLWRRESESLVHQLMLISYIFGVVYRKIDPVDDSIPLQSQQRNAGLQWTERKGSTTFTKEAK